MSYPAPAEGLPNRIKKEINDDAQGFAFKSWTLIDYKCQKKKEEEDFKALRTARMTWRIYKDESEIDYSCQ